MGCFGVHRIAGSQAVGCWQWRQLSWSRRVGCDERLWRRAAGGGARWIAHGDRGEAHVVFTEFFICSAVDFTVSRKVDMVPVASAVECAHGSECVLLLCARMAAAALAMRRRALLGRVAPQDAKLAGSLQSLAARCNFIKISSQFGLFRHVRVTPALSGCTSRDFAPCPSRVVACSRASPDSLSSSPDSLIRATGPPAPRTVQPSPPSSLSSRLSSRLLAAPVGHRPQALPTRGGRASGERAARRSCARRRSPRIRRRSASTCYRATPSSRSVASWAAPPLCSPRERQGCLA